MSHAVLVLLAFTVLPAVASSQADTSRRRDTTRVPQPQDATRRVQAARGETDLARSAERFVIDRPNHGFTSAQATELQQALGRAGCDVGSADGIVGTRTLQGIACFRGQRNLETADLEAVLTALSVSYAAPAAPPPSLTPPQRAEPVLAPVIRPDSTYRPDVIARRDSIRRDSVRRDSVRRDSTARRDTTRRPPPR